MKRCSCCGAKSEDQALECAECHQREFESLAGKLDEAGELVAAKIFSTVELAEVAAPRLRANGIECDIHADDGGGMLLPLQSTYGVRVLVLSENLADAKALLESQDT